ncbi:hypothetical protein [Hyphomonas sp.]|jgi:hypothetical protein|uniref:hypothetical protein n=1 Tax=Hyphomonas sp. TaxID=87 RepID=UPI0037C1388B
MSILLSPGAGFLVLALGGAGALVVLLLHARLQAELEGLLSRQRQASAELRRIRVDAAAVRSEAEKVASKLTVTRDYLGSELTKALEPPKPARRQVRRGS